MLSVELIDQFLCIPEILGKFPANPYVTVRHQLYQIMELPVTSLRVEDAANFPFVRVINYSPLPSTWRLLCGRRCIAVEQ